MPYKRYARRGKKPYAKRSTTTRRRNFKRKFKAGPPRSLVTRGTFATTPFPSTLNKVLTYADSFYALNQTVSGSQATVYYSGNSMYDPDIVEAGTQPKYFDTFCGPYGGTAPYRSYRVLASKIRITWMPDPTLAAGSNLMQVYCLPIDSTGGYSPTDVLDVMERPYCKYAILGNSGAQNQKTMTLFCKTRSIFGTTDPHDADCAADYGTDPPRKWQWYMGVQNVQPGGISKVLIRVQIKYYCQFFNLNRVLNS